MREFRRDVPLAHGTEYWFVEMGPIPGKPDWHTQLYASQAYPFPSPVAAKLFAANHRKMYADREIAIRFPDGHREVLPYD